MRQFTSSAPALLIWTNGPGVKSNAPLWVEADILYCTIWILLCVLVDKMLTDTLMPDVVISCFKIWPRLSYTLLIHDGTLVTRWLSTLICGRLLFGPAASGVSWSPDICHQHVAHLRSVAPRDPIFSTAVKYNQQSLLRFLYIHSAYFCPASTNSPVTLLSLLLQRFSSSLSVCWNI